MSKTKMNRVFPRKGKIFVVGSCSEDFMAYVDACNPTAYSPMEGIAFIEVDRLLHNVNNLCRYFTYENDLDEYKDVMKELTALQKKHGPDTIIECVA